MVSYTAQQIVTMVNSGKGPTDMYAGGDVAAKLSQLHTEIADDMKSLQQDMSRIGKVTRPDRRMPVPPP